MAQHTDLQVVSVVSETYSMKFRKPNSNSAQFNQMFNSFSISIVSILLMSSFVSMVNFELEPLS